MVSPRLEGRRPVRAAAADLPPGENSPVAKKSPPLRVLVVDDEPLLRWSVSETLAESGHTVVQAGDARAAIAAASTDAPAFDVVLLDFRLPDSNDLTLLATLRSLLPAARVILMTAFGTPEITRGALDLGAYSVVGKPFEIGDLASLIVEAHGSDRSQA
jgi:two-component system KDP operon response regulator KdpE